jgi:hypothetical protein
MGYQLWTSPVTGVRRRGTRFAELRSLIAAAVNARAILEPLRCCPVEAPAGEMRRALETKGFDVAGVQEKRGGPVLGYVEAAQLIGDRVSDHVLPVSAGQLISDATALGDVLLALRERKWVFVVVGASGRGIITRADLNKPPVRIYLFGLISLLEMHLRYWVQVSYGENGWQTALKPERLEAASKLQEERRKRNDQISLLACIQFGDLRKLAVDQTTIRTTLKLASKSKANDLLEDAVELRDRLAHSQDDLVEGKTWEGLIDLTVAVENLVTTSDQAVEERARASGKTAGDLWIAL